MVVYVDHTIQEAAGETKPRNEELVVAEGC
jgi:hypothetical protein